MIGCKRLLRDSRAAGAVEFALAAPVFIMMVIGVVQLGTLFFANAGLRNAVGHGARYATIYPRPSTEDIKSKVQAHKFGLKPQYLTAPEITYGKADGADYAVITISYDVPLDFIFFEVPPVRLTETRRVFVQPVA